MGGGGWEGGWRGAEGRSGKQTSTCFVNRQAQEGSFPCRGDFGFAPGDSRMTVEGGGKRGLARKRARNARFPGDARYGGWAIWGLEGVRRGQEGCARVAMVRARGPRTVKKIVQPPMDADARGFGGCAAGAAESRRRGDGEARSLRSG